ncbi:MAG TPA: CoA pyrophosphatase [Acidimicrobiales bacterium]|nr:CoA pyrophosphatase [Acidimicrobiales bacterium]
MTRPTPPQVIPRPTTWRLGAPAPWAALPEADRRGIGIDTVLAALAARGQSGPVPEDVGLDRVLGPTVLVDAVAPAVRAVNAGVLAVLFEEQGEARVVLTRRSFSLRSHRGEVSFPGGRMDTGEDAAAAAVREAHEEVALDPAGVTVVGWIHPVLTVGSGSLIMPLLATVPSRPHLVPSPDEVERVFDVQLSELADPDVFREEYWSIPGREIPSSPDNSFAVWFFEVAGEIVWGATARMLHELLSIVLVPAPK